MMYRPYRVTKNERLAFQLKGDKLDHEIKNPKRERLPKEQLELHWTRMMQQLMPTEA